jgi:hypothetical protein
MESDIISEEGPFFYKTFLDISMSNDQINPDQVKLLRNRDFTKYIIENEIPTISVKILSCVMSHGLLKPQRLLDDNEDYYIAIDLLTNTYYICYRDLMMIDIDKYKRDDTNIDTLDDIKNKLSFHPDLYFRIYSSRNGYHIFILNESMDYKSDKSISLMHELGCDFYYIVYSYLRGWSVRLNKKKGENFTDDLYKWTGDVVKGIFFPSDLENQKHREIIKSEKEISSTSAEILSTPLGISQTLTEILSTSTETLFSLKVDDTADKERIVLDKIKVSEEKEENDENEKQHIDTFNEQLNLINTEEKMNYDLLYELDYMPDSRLEMLTDLHIELTHIFKNVGMCLMPAPVSKPIK